MSSNKSHLIITVHGIRTFGKWQERLEGLVRSSGDVDHIAFCHYKLGYFSILAFLVPPTRWLVVRRFREEIRALCRSREWLRIDLVGHSFGTHVIGWALWGLSEHERIPTHTVILSGSVLRSGFNWARLIGSRVSRVINDCGTQDAVLLLSQFFVLFTGMAGRVGFSGMTSENFRNRFSPFGHSGYFVNMQGSPDDKYMQDNWVELLTASKPIHHFNMSPDESPLRGLMFWMGNNAEPVKLTFYLAPLLAFAFWVWGQRQEAVQQRDLASARAEIAINALIGEEVVNAARDIKTREAIELAIKDGQKQSLERLGISERDIKYAKYRLLKRMTVEDKSPAHLEVRARSDRFALMWEALQIITDLASSGDAKFVLERNETSASYWQEVCSVPGSHLRRPPCDE
ncbi:hypothetical protein GIW81_04525 [Hyphomicrobium sp. xq]|uniref:Alpha/beta hydrolase n=1 Tax=Hyphomicrobium album TaxID=2665159 RepID=A0A6I3KGI6_9HYPH|nr:hypothetical protein [Hyphomicrobium album]MTD93598.1 hypothetical protein [Hyphomicrobium album]